jgi:hypothetical protein
MLIKFLMAIVLTEAITELVVKSKIFEPLRAKLFDLAERSKVFKWLHELIDCGYCFSVWTGWLVAFLLFFGSSFIIHKYVDWIILGLVLHRLSNVFHFIVDRLHGIDT